MTASEVFEIHRVFLKTERFRNPCLPQGFSNVKRDKKSGKARLVRQGMLCNIELRPFLVGRVGRTSMIPNK